MQFGWESASVKLGLAGVVWLVRTLSDRFFGWRPIMTFTDVVGHGS
jgi:hypothetical protein